MELLGARALRVFYDEADQRPGANASSSKASSASSRGWRPSIRSSTGSTPTPATRATADGRVAAAARRFGSQDVDWTGYEDVRESMWQRQLHLFHVPFYYVEYGIAQLGALQLWMKAKEDPQPALCNYRAGLELGGTRPLPELFAAAGIRLRFFGEDASAADECRARRAGGIASIKLLVFYCRMLVRFTVAHVLL